MNKRREKSRLTVIEQASSKPTHTKTRTKPRPDELRRDGGLEQPRMLLQSLGPRSKEQSNERNIHMLTVVALSTATIS